MCDLVEYKHAGRINLSVGTNIYFVMEIDLVINESKAICHYLEVQYVNIEFFVDSQYQPQLNIDFVNTSREV